MMKRKMWKRLASLALAVVMATALVPGAFAVEAVPEGGTLVLSGNVTYSDNTYQVSFRADIAISEDMAKVVDFNRADTENLKKLRFRCTAENPLVSAFQETNLTASAAQIENSGIFDLVETSKTGNQISVVYKLDESTIETWGTKAAGEVAAALQEPISMTFSDALSMSQVWNCIASADSVTTTGSVVLTSSDGNIPYYGGTSATLASAAFTTAISPIASGGSGGAGGSGGSGNITETTTNPDGSITTTVTEPDGTVTETTTWPDGSKEVVETKPDGSVTTTVDREDGSSTTTMDKDGKVESEVTLPEAVVDAAEEENESIALPMPPVNAGSSSDDAPVITVNLPDGRSARIAVPVDGMNYGIVVVQINDDGTEEIVVNSIVENNHIVAVVSDGDRLKIIDNSKYFIDVPDEHWGATYVEFVASRELFNGTSANMFSPEAPMSRAMILTVLARYEGVDTTGGSTWYEQGVQWAVADGISDGTNLDAALSREQLATMLWRYVGSPAVEKDLSAYTDSADISDWAKEGMMWAVNAGLITGTDQNALNPQGGASRVEVAAILARFVVAVTLANS